MPSAISEPVLCRRTHFHAMLTLLNGRLRRLCSRLRWPIRRRSRSKVVIQKFGKSKSSTKNDSFANGSAAVHPKGPKTQTPIRVATFNAAMFSMAPVLPKPGYRDEIFTKNRKSLDMGLRAKSRSDHPRSILKQSPLRPNTEKNSDQKLSKQQKFTKSELRVSINLPDNEISLLRSRQMSFREEEGKEVSSNGKISRDKAPLRSTLSFPTKVGNECDETERFRSSRTVLQVLKELDADILALQDVKAEEEKEMKPLSDLASALGMNYVFAESWAPEYGNAILSKWPIKHWKVQKIFDDTDFRNVLKAIIDVPQIGELNFHCTHLDHLDEDWRMKQIKAIIQSNDGPHILAGGLNSLDETDYSLERWMDIVKYYEEMGKPTPKHEVMKFLKSKEYTDAKDFAGECESVVIIAKGQSVQGTCKYGTRVDYILTSPNSPCKFVPGSYSVVSSKGTSDHHIVKADIVKVDSSPQENMSRKQRRPKQKVIKIKSSSPITGIWRT